ncbi:MAG: hypothetical protein Q8N60_03800 [Candidatus Diapherotrites archaeon]|nr:hypothetical protein [Candidatus Diapherotrites archaeon]
MPSAEFALLNFIALLLLGFFASYTDLRSGKIHNKAVFPAIAIAFALNFFSAGNWPSFLLNGFFAFLFGFLLFLARLWSAADSKLFLAFALLFPADFFNAQFLFFPSFALILNAFIPAFFVMFLFALLKTSREQKIAALKSAFQPKQVASIAVILFAFYWLLSAFFSFLQIPLDFFLIILLLFFLIAAIESVFPKKLVLVCGVVSIAFLFLKFNEVILVSFVSNFFFLIAIMLFLRFFVLYLGFFSFGRRKEIAELRPGMVLLEGVYEKGGVLEKKKLFFPCLVNVLQDIKTKYVVDISAKGISEKEIAILRKANAAGKVKFHSLLVQETLPFAPILFIGVLLSLLCPSATVCFLSF